MHTHTPHKNNISEHFTKMLISVRQTEQGSTPWAGGTPLKKLWKICKIGFGIQQGHRQARIMPGSM